MERLFSGIYGIVLTPFTEKGEVDLPALKEQVSRAAANIHLAGLVVNGSTGEFSRLSFDENVSLMRTVKEANAGRKQLIFGATAGDSFTAARYIKEICDLGADGILLAPPYYFTLSEDELFAYYEEALKANTKNIPVIGYNIPQCTNAISVSLFKRLLENKMVKGFKNSWNNMADITEEIILRNTVRPDVAMFTGLDGCLCGTLGLGGDGVFSAISYLIPEIMYYIFENYNDGFCEKALACQGEIIKLVNVINQFTFPYGYRLLAEATGYPLGVGREAIPTQLKEKSVEAVGQMREMVEKLQKIVS